MTANMLSTFDGHLFRANPCVTWRPGCGGWVAATSQQFIFGRENWQAEYTGSTETLMLLGILQKPISASEAFRRFAPQSQVSENEFCELFRRLLVENLIFDLTQKTYRSLIISSGGVGTSFLMKFASKYISLPVWNGDLRLKHLWAPPISLNGVERVLFVTGDLRDAAISLFRRRQHPEVAFYNSHRYLLTHEDTISEYAEYGEDYLGLIPQTAGWCQVDESMLDYSLMIVDYRDIWDRVESIVNYLQLPPESAAAFPEYKPRLSTKETVETSTWNRLGEIYGACNGMIDQIRKR